MDEFLENEDGTLLVLEDTSAIILQHLFYSLMDEFLENEDGTLLVLESTDAIIVDSSGSRFAKDTSTAPVYIKERMG